MPRPKLPQSVLIIRLSAIGDVIMATGLIPALHQLNPNLHLSWLTEDSQQALIADHPQVKQVFVLPRRRWQGYWRTRQYRQLWREMRDLMVALRAQNFDLILDLQGLLRSGIWAFLAGGGWRIGLGSREGSGLLMHEVLDRHTEDPRLGSEYRKLAATFGLADSAFALAIALSDNTRARAQAILRQAGVQGPFMVICPFTTRPQKHWIESRWTALAQGLYAIYGCPVLVLGGPADTAAAVRLTTAAGMVNLAGQTTLIECAALIAEARLLIGVDTGLTHLGTAMKIPTLALFGSTRPYLDTACANGKVLYAALPCSPCRRRPTCDGRFDCMAAHQVEAILAEVSTLLEITT